MDYQSIAGGIGDLALTTSEKIIDSKIYGSLGFLDDISKVAGFALSIPDRIFVRHTVAFFRGFRKKSNDEKYEEAEAILSDSNRRYKVGIIILELINKTDSEIKAEIIGEIWAHTLATDRGINEFYTLAQMINSMYQRDLDYFLKNSNGIPEDDETGLEIEHLVSTGAYERVYKGFGDTASMLKKPRISDEGRKILDILKR